MSADKFIPKPEDIFKFVGGPADDLFLTLGTDPETMMPRPEVLLSDSGAGEAVFLGNLPDSKYSYAFAKTYNFVCLIPPEHP